MLMIIISIIMIAITIRIITRHIRISHSHPITVTAFTHALAPGRRSDCGAEKSVVIMSYQSGSYAVGSPEEWLAY